MIEARVRGARALLVYGALAAVVAGCDDGPSEASSLERARVLGARIEVAGAPERSSPEPGEAFDVHWLVRGPRGPSEVDYVLHTCLAPPRGPGLPVCERRLEKAARGRSETPTAHPTAPRESGLDPLLMLGAFCEEGRSQVDRDTLLGRCEGSDLRPEVATTYVDLGGDNRNPQVADDAEVWVAGERWPASAEGECRGPTLSATDPSLLRVRLPESAREVTEDGREELLVSHFATRGAFERLFTVIERDADSAELKVEWDPREGRPAKGEVRVVLVVRDQRGGTDWLERCAVVDAE